MHKSHWDPAALLGRIPINFNITKIWLYKTNDSSKKKTLEHAYKEIFTNLSGFQCLLSYKAATTKIKTSQIFEELHLNI